MKPFFSVLTTTYNVWDYVVDTIYSVRAQGYPFYEYIIVDDCSDDEVTYPYLKEHFTRPNERLYRLPEKKCCGYALNKAFSIAGGKYAVILDGDDMLSPDALCNMADCIKENSGYSLYYSKYFMFHNLPYDVHPWDYDKERPFSSRFEKGRFIPVNSRPLPKNRSFLELFTLRTERSFRGLDDELKGVQVSHLKVVDIEAYKKTPGIAKHLDRGVDVELILLMEEMGNFYFLDKELYVYRRRKGSLSWNARHIVNEHSKGLNYDIINRAKERRGIK